ncbi:unnamed protein product [Cyclocybe aegerita]|uniref:Uncharacterized protein n=1 Tax=Cyclocybe aegerita TaxID=1973307 RepID=A0A8S0XF99_CYCAE|nr:unnamed protein product [Cyclocybe aegerita]
MVVTEEEIDHDVIDDCNILIEAVVQETLRESAVPLSISTASSHYLVQTVVRTEDGLVAGGDEEDIWAYNDKGEKWGYCRFCKYVTGEKSASNPKLKFEFSINTSNTTLRNHLENVHKEEYLCLCTEKGWNNLLSKSRVQMVAAPEAAHGTQGAFRTPFTQKAFIQHLINFVVADDQVGHWTLDNASVNAKFLEELQVLLEVRDIPFNAKDRHIMCFPHVINICVTHITESFTDLALASDEAKFAASLPPADPCQQTFDKACAQDPIALCRGTVCAIHASGKRRELFQDIIRNSNEKEWFKAANDPNKIIKLENLELLRDV